MKNFKIMVITMIGLSISAQSFGAAMSQKDQEKAAIKATGISQFVEPQIQLPELPQERVQFIQPRRRIRTIEQSEQERKAVSAPAQGRIITPSPIVRPSAGYSRLITPEAPTIQRAMIQQPKPRAATSQAPEIKHAAALQQRERESKLSREIEFQNELQLVAKQRRAQLSPQEQQKLDGQLQDALLEGESIPKIHLLLIAGANPNSLIHVEGAPEAEIGDVFPGFEGMPFMWATLAPGYQNKKNIKIKDIINKLAQFGADFTRKLSNGKTILHFLVVFSFPNDEKTAMKREALKQGYNADMAKEFWYNMTRNFDDELIHALVEHGVDVNARTVQGFTPLHYAALSYRGGEDFINALIKYGADINARDNIAGGTPLMFAAVRPSIRSRDTLNPNGRAIRFLLDNGAAPFIRDVEGKEASDYLDPNKGRRKNRKTIQALRQTLENYKQSIRQAVQYPITEEEAKQQQMRVETEAKRAGREKEIVEVHHELRDIVAEYLFGEEQPQAEQNPSSPAKE